MTSYGELGVRGELSEALAKDRGSVSLRLLGDVVPVVRRGNNLALEAGPGGGFELAYGAGLLDRLEDTRGELAFLIVVATQSEAVRLARRLGPYAAAVGARAAALDPAWADPARADMLFAPMAGVLEALRDGVFSASAVRALVLSGLSDILAMEEGSDSVRTLFELVPKDAQRIFASLPWTAEVESLADGTLKRAVHLPPRPAAAAAKTRKSTAPDAWELRFRLLTDTGVDSVVGVVAELAAVQHGPLWLFASSDQRRDALSSALLNQGLIQYGDDALVLGPEDPVPPNPKVLPTTVSMDVPADADTLLSRHREARDRVVILHPRELPHLRDLVKRSGNSVRPFPPKAMPLPRSVARVRARVDEIIAADDLGPELLLLEPLFERHHPAQVAAALAGLLRAREGAGGTSSDPTQSQSPARSGGSAPAGVVARVRLFLSIGEKDGIRPGDLLGAIAGESGIKGDKVGKIEIRESFSLVEVEDTVADRVIQAMNGVTFRGRSVRADYDRGSRGQGPKEGRGRTDRGPGRKLKG